MKIQYSKALNAKSDLLIYPVFEGQKSIKEKKLNKFYSNLLKDKLLTGKAGESALVYPVTSGLPKSILFIGLGKKAKLKSSAVRNAFANATKARMSEKVNKLGVYLEKDLAEYLGEVAEGLTLVNYYVSKYKTGKDGDKAKNKLYTELHVYTDLKEAKKVFEKAGKIREAVNLVRDLVNGPPNKINVDYLANEAKKIAKENKLSVTIRDKAWIEKMKMGSFLSVNKGSGKKGAKLVILEYKPKKANKQKPIMIVGKGLIFDSGGYNIKPTKHIEDMQQDMAGGAVVLGVFKLLNFLKVNRRVIGIIPITENLIDSEAQLPSDIVTAYNGKTIEIRNTDAEGRMILADALSYGVEKYKPEYTIDLATLTGACLVALGDRYAGIMGNDEGLTGKLLEAGKATDELLWELPIHDDFREIMKGRLADLRNIDNGTSYLGGASKAAAFLEYFVDKAKWAHLDIAGTAYVEKAKAVDYPMGTGYGVRLLVNFLENL